MVAEVQGGDVSEISQTVVDGQLTPDPNSPGSYRFQVTPHSEDEQRVAQTGMPATSASAEPLPSAITGTWDVWDNRYVRGRKHG